MKCCGFGVSTRYCPHCGKDHLDADAASLLAHLRKTIAGKKSKIKKYPGSAENEKLPQWERWENWVVRKLVDLPPANCWEHETAKLSLRARKAIRRMEVKSFAELSGKTETQLLGERNFGQGALREIKEMLGRQGMSLQVSTGFFTEDSADAPKTAD